MDAGSGFLRRRFNQENTTLITKRKLLQVLAAAPVSAAVSSAWGQAASSPSAPASSVARKPVKRPAPRTAGAEGSAATAAAASAINWPTKPLRVLVGFPTGSAPDLAARAVSDGLSKVLGQPVIVENKPGASGNLAADLVAKSQDNHTIGALINGNLTVAKLLNPAVPFDPAKDFAPISLLGTAPLVLAVASTATGNTPTELLFWARGLEARGNYGTPGSGTVGHLGMELC
jgi:tripartite-type tricarboxylate transporter receptor subunit TctC